MGERKRDENQPSLSMYLRDVYFFLHGFISPCAYFYAK
jgi:hypothetical protein